MSTATLLPQPVKSGWTWDYKGSKNRSLKAFYPLGPVVESVGLSGKTKTEQVGVEVSVMHNKDRKEFLAVANRMTKGRDGVFETSSYSLFDGVTLSRKPVARYSDKALEAEFERVLAVLPDLVEQHEGLAEKFVPVVEEG